MQRLKIVDGSHKYMKPTELVGYHSQLVYSPSPSSRRLRLPGSLHSVRRTIIYLGSEYFTSYLFVAAFVVMALCRQVFALRSVRIEVTEVARSLFNWFCALIGSVLALPLFLIIALAIKLDSSGPVFFRQLRVGIDRRRSNRRESNLISPVCRRNSDRRKKNNYGRPFTVYKFRTMIIDAEKKCGPIWATRNDPRITKVGLFLRRTRLDELPQLLNVLKGEMSIVGPRPERPFFIERLAKKIDGYTRRLQVKPGITGLAQVESGYDESDDDVKIKVHYDLKYIDSSGLRRDLMIILRTIVVVLGCRGL